MDVGCRSRTSVLTDNHNFLQQAENIKVVQDNLRDSGWCVVLLTKIFRNQSLLIFPKNLEITRSHEHAARNVVNLLSSFDVHHPKDSILPSSFCRCGITDHCQSNCKLKTATCHYCGKIGHINMQSLSISLHISLQAKAENKKCIQQNIIEPISFSDCAAPIIPVMISDKVS